LRGAEPRLNSPGTGRAPMVAGTVPEALPDSKYVIV
jgi:hypothetical protein